MLYHIYSATHPTKGQTHIEPAFRCTEILLKDDISPIGLLTTKTTPLISPIGLLTTKTTPLISPIRLLTTKNTPLILSLLISPIRLLTTKTTPLISPIRLLKTKNPLLSLLCGYSQQRIPSYFSYTATHAKDHPSYLSYTATHNKEHPLISPIRLLTTKNTLLSLL